LGDELGDRGEIALALVIGRRIGGDVDEIAAGEVARLGGEANAIPVGGEQLVEIRLEDREIVLAEALHHLRIGVKCPDREPLRRGGDRGNDTEMRHPGKANDSSRHQPFHGPKITAIRRFRARARDNMRPSYRRTALRPSSRRRV